MIIEIFWRSVKYLCALPYVISKIIHLLFPLVIGLVYIVQCHNYKVSRFDYDIDYVFYGLLIVVIINAAVILLLFYGLVCHMIPIYYTLWHILPFETNLCAITGTCTRIQRPFEISFFTYCDIIATLKVLTDYPQIFNIIVEKLGFDVGSIVCQFLGFGFNVDKLIDSERNFLILPVKK